MSAHGSLAIRQGALAVKALQQRTLTRTCFANQVNQFTGANGQIDVLQYGVLGDGYAAIFDVNQGRSFIPIRIVICRRAHWAQRIPR